MAIRNENNSDRSLLPHESHNHLRFSSRQNLEEVFTEIVPLVGEQIVTANTISISVSGDDRRRAEAIVERTSVIVSVTDNASFMAAKRAAGELKALVDEINDSRKAAKRPFSAVEKAIDDVAAEVGLPVMSEQKRVLGLLNGYVAQLEAAAKEEQRKKDEALKRQIAQQEAALKEAQAAQAKAEEEARKAKDEAGRLRAQEEARRRAQAAEAAQLAAEMAAEIAQIGEKPPKGFVPGGRVDHKWTFRLVSIIDLVKAGCWRLVRWELDQRACMDSCKAQLEIAPDIEPTLPGIEITKTINVSVRASAKIE